MSKQLVRCIRVIEYIGPKDWLDATLQQSAVTKKGTRFHLASDRQITEIARTICNVGPSVSEVKDYYEVGSGRPSPRKLDQVTKDGLDAIAVAEMEQARELDEAYTQALGNVEDYK